MAKRASTNYSFLVGIDKPAGMSSHDCVNVARRIYGERRIGHTGTLDPAATGALILCVGPATRLDRFLVGHSKVYEFTCAFGVQTSTDDAEGDVLAEKPVPAKVCDEACAREALSWMLGAQEQIPPAYSAIKVGGKKAYAAARAGQALNLQPRSIEVYSLELLSLDASNPARPTWLLRAHVSAGTYVRSLARDLGATVGTCAHVGALRRVRLGNLKVEECVSLEALETQPFEYLLDPLKLLGVRFAFATDEQAKKLANGAALPESLELFEYEKGHVSPDAYCACTSGVVRAPSAPTPGEIVGIIDKNKLAALYEYQPQRRAFVSACGFATGVARGAHI